MAEILLAGGAVEESGKRVRQQAPARQAICRKGCTIGKMLLAGALWRRAFGKTLPAGTLQRRAIGKMLLAGSAMAKRMAALWQRAIGKTLQAGALPRRAIGKQAGKEPPRAASEQKRERQSPLS